MKTRLLLSVFVLASAAHAFNASGQRWSAGEVRFQLALPPPTTALSDGSGSWNAVIEDAMAIWNTNVSAVRLAATRDSTAALGEGNAARPIACEAEFFGLRN